MTIEELSVRITAEADEALGMLDQVTQRLTGLEGLLGQTVHIGVDTNGASKNITLLEEQLATLGEHLGQQTRQVARALEGVLAGLDGGLTGLQTALGNNGSMRQELAQVAQVAGSMKELAQAFQQSTEDAGRMQSALQGAGQQLVTVSRAADDMGESYREMGSSIHHTGDAIAGSAQRLYGQLGNVISWAQDTAENLQIEGRVQVDTGSASTALNSLIHVATAAQSSLVGLGIAAGIAGVADSFGAGGGNRTGSGSGSGSVQAAAAEASRTAEDIFAQSLKLIYAVIDHKRHMNEITLEEEIQLLKELRARRQMNAAEIMDWEERLFDAQQAIRKRDAESLDRLSRGLVDALGEKYEAMRDAEMQRVEESRRAWETWRDDSVRAIDDQIAALDRLAAAEEREDQDAEELRRIEKLKRDIAYEQDAYNRRMLEEQLQRAMDDREKRLRRQELEDQKAALKAQADEVERQAQQELDRLDAEGEAIEALYRQRLEAAALEAEAEKLLMENNQQEILSLLEAFVPEYDLLGRTMGERLAAGFQQSVGNVVGWFEQLSGQLDSVWSGMVSAAGQQTAALARGTVSQTQPPADVTISQTVNFNQPVESPGDVARRMESVNQALGEWMSQEG